MIYCKEFPERSFTSQQEMLKAIVDNKRNILALKKSAIKESDSFAFGYVEAAEKGEVIKANEPVADAELGQVKVKVVINTIGLLDSHRDVHIKGIWKRSLEHSNVKLHLQEHNKKFADVIADDALAYTRYVTWKSLGADYEGSTEALIFESTVKASRNEEMFKQYSNGWVRNHSVGMQYVDIKVCINSEEKWAAEEKENWDKYYPMVANKEDADAIGYFYAVTEAKVIEGSAVVIGSNWATPTLENDMKTAPAPSENNDPPTGTQTRTKTYYSGFLN